MRANLTAEQIVLTDLRSRRDGRTPVGLHITRGPHATSEAAVADAVLRAIAASDAHDALPAEERARIEIGHIANYLRTATALLNTMPNGSDTVGGLRAVQAEAVHSIDLALALAGNWARPTPSASREVTAP